MRHKRHKKRTEAEIHALVRPFLRGDEVIRDWQEYPPGQMTVTLASAEMLRDIRSRFGRGNARCGRGRLLVFELRDGEWIHTGGGGWIS